MSSHSKYMDYRHQHLLVFFLNCPVTIIVAPIHCSSTDFITKHSKQSFNTGWKQYIILLCYNTTCPSDSAACFVLPCVFCLLRCILNETELKAQLWMFCLRVRVTERRRSGVVSDDTRRVGKPELVWRQKCVLYFPRTYNSRQCRTRVNRHILDKPVTSSLNSGETVAKRAFVFDKKKDDTYST